MKVRRLVLENFRSHARTEIEFGDGIIAVIGENGAGKTSILEAIAYALFPDLFRGKTESLIRDGADLMRVTLDFEVNGRTYRVVRERFRKGQPQALIQEVGDGARTLQRGQKNVNIQVVEILGINPEVLISAIYVRQGEIASLVEETPSERRKLIGKLMKIDQLEKIWGDLGEVITELQSELYRIQGEIASLSGVEDELIDLKKRKELLEVKREELESKVHLISSRINQLESMINELESKRSEYLMVKSAIDRKVGERDHLKAKVEALNGELSSLDAEISKLRDALGDVDDPELAIRAYEIYMEIERLSLELRSAKEWKERIDKIRKELSEMNVEESVVDKLRDIEDNIRKLQSDLTNKKGELAAATESMRSKKVEIIKLRSELERKISDISRLLGRRVSVEEVDLFKDAVERLEEDLLKLEHKRDRVLSEISGLRERIREDRESLNSLKTAGDRCPICGSPLTKEKKEALIRELNNRISENESKVMKLTKEQSELIKAIELVRSKLNALRRYNEDELKEAYQRLTSLESEVRALEDRISVLKDEIKELEKRLNELIASSRELREKTRILERKKYLQEQLEMEMKREIPDVTELRRKIEKLRKELLIITAKFGIKSGEMIFIKEKLSKVRDFLKRLDKLAGRRSALKDELLKLMDRIREVDEELSRLRYQLSSIGYSPDEHNRALAEYKQLVKSRTSIERELGSIKGEIAALEMEIKSKEKALTRLKYLRKKSRSTEEFISLLTKVRDVFHREKGVQRFVRERARPLIEAKASEIFSSFGFRYDSLEVDQDYTPFLVKDGRKYGTEKMSGGELIAAALSLRLALANFLVTSEVESFFLDEPTIHLDENRVDSLIDSLSQMDVPQLIVVTHSGKFMNVADQTILVRKESGISKIEVIKGLERDTLNTGYST